jgi:hypothetical protein
MSAPDRVRGRLDLGSFSSCRTRSGIQVHNEPKASWIPGQARNDDANHKARNDDASDNPIAPIDTSNL